MRKISLLLAFVMIFSLLPMTVMGSDVDYNRTGERRELHPMQSVVHTQEGTVVARPGVANHFLNHHTRPANEIFVMSDAAPVHIVAAADYFLMRRVSSTATIRPVLAADVTMNMSLSNAYWLINNMANLPAIDSTTVAALTSTAIAYAEYSFKLEGEWFTLAAWIEPGLNNADAILRLVIVDEDRNFIDINNTDVFRTVTQAQLAQMARVYLPVEFLTRNGANEEPIILTYDAIGDWHTPGTMTVSTVPTEKRFIMSSPGEINRFKGFNPVEIHDSIRVAEGTPDAFRSHWYYVRLHILTPGFEWTPSSLSDITLAARHGDMGLSLPTFINPFTGETWYNRFGAHNIGILPNSQNRTIQFSLNTDVAALLQEQRVQMDWINIESLSIVANDRAQVGDVYVGVVVYSLVSEDLMQEADGARYVRYSEVITVATFEGDNQNNQGDEETFIINVGLSGQEQVTMPIQAELAQETTEIRLTIGDTQLSVNGVPVDDAYAPFIDPEYNRTMVPLRLITETLGAQVDWNAETRTVTITTTDGQTSLIQVDTPLPYDMGMATIVYNRTFVPINYLGLAFDLDIRWDGDARAVYVNS